MVEHGATFAHQLLEVHVADVARVVVAGDHDHPLAGDPRQVVGRLLKLAPQAVAGQVAGDDHHVRLELVDLDDRPVEQARNEERRAAVQV